MSAIPEISLRERIRINLVSAMEEAGLTQVQFAEKLGISKGTVNNWVRGNNSPDVDMVPKICNVLNIPVLFLYSPTKLEPIEKSKKSPPCSGEAMKLAKDYDGMDRHGQEIVRLVADKELERLRTEPAVKPAAPEESKVVRFSIPGFSLPMSAGTGEEAGQEYPENYTLVKEPPRGTSYIARVSGHSMEPTFNDGDLLFVHACDEIPVGEIGAFFMDGQQWIKELGDGALISHNPEYTPRPMTEDIRCQGLVLGVCDESYLE